MAVCNIRNPNRSITYSNGDPQSHFDDSAHTRNEKKRAVKTRFDPKDVELLKYEHSRSTIIEPR